MAVVAAASAVGRRWSNARATAAARGRAVTIRLSASMAAAGRGLRGASRRSAAELLAGVDAAAARLAAARHAPRIVLAKMAATGRRGAVALRAGAQRGFGALGAASAAVAVVVLMMVVTVGQSGRSKPVLWTTGMPGVELADTAATSGAGRDVTDLFRDLRNPAMPEEHLVAIVDRVADDPHDAVTEALLAAAESPSVVVSMASVRALRGRPCSRVGAALVQRLAHRDWQRRAWAAKVLGENGCVAAAPELRRRLRNEHDRRVRAQLSGALAMVRAGTPG
jgi:hypothetical protein